ncbi:MAG: hypothetical protein LQ352_004621 [Teloschistes flavicans]|nr:MAG: hypothetical protein LQ352_004621 [Teloschistes flavicans]
MLFSSSSKNWNTIPLPPPRHISTFSDAELKESYTEATQYSQALSDIKDLMGRCLASRLKHLDDNGVFRLAAYEVLENSLEDMKKVGVKIEIFAKEVQTIERVLSELIPEREKARERAHRRARAEAWRCDTQLPTRNMDPW